MRLRRQGATRRRARRFSPGSGSRWSGSSDRRLRRGVHRENHKRVTVHFVLFSARTSVIWVILLTLAIGLVGGLLLSQL